MNNQTNIKNELLCLKEKIIEQENLEIIKTYGTFEKEKGKKDVSLCKKSDGKKIILRIGEIQSDYFFPNGFKGKHIIIPKIFKQNSEEIVYEIEEYLEGAKICDLEKETQPQGVISNPMLSKLINAFWEFQIIGRQIPLEDKYTIEKIEKHYNKAKQLLPKPELIDKIIHGNINFWKGQFPAKWKFALNNLILTNDNKIGFIDNANVGLRFLGYDLGWIIWPRWISMETEYYSKIESHYKYLLNFQKILIHQKPTQIKINEKELIQAFWLVIFERIIGSLFDIVDNTKHLKTWQLDKQGDKKRIEKHVNFLNNLLNKTTENIQQYTTLLAP